MSKRIYENKVASDAAKRFRMLCEYTFNITEDDGEEMMDEPSENEQPDSESPTDNQGGEGNNMTPPMGDSDNMGSVGVPNNDSEQDTESPMGATDTGAPGFNPDMNSTEGNPMDNNSEDDEVIDVDDLTQSQEETEEKVDDIQVSMEKGFSKLLSVVDKLNQMIDNSTANMEEIRQEIEKRNPTPLEKLNMRAANDSYPFNVSPNDYWKNKEVTSNYRIGGENEDDAPQYTITQGDIDKMTDYQKISQELNSDEFNQNLLNIFGLR